MRLVARPLGELLPFLPLCGFPCSGQKKGLSLPSPKERRLMKGAGGRK